MPDLFNLVDPFGYRDNYVGGVEVTEVADASGFQSFCYYRLFGDAYLSRYS